MLPCPPVWRQQQGKQAGDTDIHGVSIHHPASPVLAGAFRGASYLLEEPCTDESSFSELVRSRSSLGRHSSHDTAGIQEESA